MPTLTIRNVPEPDRDALRIRAATNGRSMEAELRLIIHEALATQTGADVFTSIRQHVDRFGGFDLPEITRDPAPEPPDFT